MTTKCISAGGYPVTVATEKDIQGATYTLPKASTSAIGGVKKMATQEDSVATDVPGLLADFNALLAKMKTAGVM